MKVVIPGGSGFLGRALADALLQDGHEVVVLTRALEPGVVVHEAGTGLPGLSNAGWRPDGTDGVGRWAAVVDGADAVVNLTGESIAARRWSTAQKARIRDSRVLATQSVVGAIRAAANPPPTLVNASAVGYYGNRGDQELDEASSPGDDFLAASCVDWETAARELEASIDRLVILRGGVALDRNGGPLERMVVPFRLFVGGPLGSGRQYISWIHRADWVDLVRWVLATPTATGVLNATAPAPVTNLEFSKALGHALGRPSFLPAPPFALRLALGELADALLLGGQRVLPSRALALGFNFRFSTINHALVSILQ
ncbi:MAG: TIGR01777 family oxidoreductase [Vicinamibacterales bacterium]|jgi:hypothetical protein|nr:TIGR01777 family protein [Acidobacteriota bacterium]MDP6372612.1 TIGR01777 family oxidoreductase [Vicinamibacterales bacterium]MDP6610590.1 TIGR01777 family oxidoreductase [Vicinamibacterales bacterium]HAK54967.1 TIGR01777 family protein [Acidobacteriota bacterium]|tara:strand:+ start:11507 stop:12445 length:939 start_codon:yes stop_codon:yes gene_type:complete